MNASFGGGDDAASVARNRALVAESLGVAPDSLVGLTQVHGRHVVPVSSAWPSGTGERADAMVSDHPGIALGIVTADCAPVLLRDPEAVIAGAAHAGWRGAVEGVLEATVEAMLRLGADASRITAVVGPCIGQASYEVAADLRDAVLPSLPNADRFFAPGIRPERWQFDLGRYCEARLARCDLHLVASLRLDSAADPDRFFSHRRRTLGGGGPIGHQISAIVV